LSRRASSPRVRTLTTCPVGAEGSEGNGPAAGHPLRIAMATRASSASVSWRPGPPTAPSPLPEPALAPGGVRETGSAIFGGPAAQRPSSDGLASASPMRQSDDGRCRVALDRVAALRPRYGFTFAKPRPRPAGRRRQALTALGSRPAPPFMNTTLTRWARFGLPSRRLRRRCEHPL